ncbi:MULTISPECIES: glutaredoxin family protein [Bacillus]|uniref:glutaredoxin family protein n=1 Tax=Bacillus TaxID=1386 RepID=UPI0002D2F5EC|nr:MULTISPECIES: glutaredoxin family protein [Bacillus]
MEELILYSKDNCHLCDMAKRELEKIKQSEGVSFREIDIYQDDELLEEYGLMIPVVEYQGEMIQYGQIDFQSIRIFLNNKK